METLSSAWQFQVPIVKLAVAFVIAESPMWIRRAFRVLYVPVYAPFLHEAMNEDLALYYGEDFFGRGIELSDDDLSRVRRRMMLASFMSMAVSVVLTPLAYGTILALLLDRTTFLEFLAFMAAYRAMRCRWSYRDFGSHGIASRSARLTLGVVYVLYVGATAQIAYNGYRWATPFVAARDWAGMLGALSNLLFVDGVVFGLMVAAASTLFSNVVADPQLRRDHVKTLKERYASLDRLRAAPAPVPADAQSPKP